MAPRKRRISSSDIEEDTDYPDIREPAARPRKRLATTRTVSPREEDHRLNRGRSVYPEVVSSPIEPEFTLSQASQLSDSDPNKLYAARAILDETETHFLIDWEGCDLTGKAYEPSWEEKSFANAALRQEWEGAKSQRAELSPTPQRAAFSPATQRAQRLKVEIVVDSNLDHDAYERFSQVPLSSQDATQEPSQQPITHVRCSSPPHFRPPVEASPRQALDILVPDSQSTGASQLESDMAEASQSNGAAYLSTPTTPIHATMPSIDRLMNDDGAFGGRSPSVIPGPETKSPVGDSRLVADDTGVTEGDLEEDMPQFPADIMDERPAEVESDAAPTTLDHLTISSLPSNEHVVALQLPGRLRDDYFKLLANHPDIIRRLFRTHDLTQSIRQDATDLIQRLNNLCTHPDLNDSTTNAVADIEGSEQFNGWCEQMSPKFAFLKIFLNHLGKDQLTVLVVCKDGPLVRFLHKFLVTSNFSTSIITAMPGMTTSFQSSHPDRRATVVIQPLQPSQDKFQVPVQAHVVIAIDDSYRLLKPSVKSSWPRSFSGPPKMAPVIHPIVFASPEHVLMAQPDNIKAEHSLKALMHCIIQTRSFCGEVSPEYYNTEGVAEEAAHFVKRGATPTWWTLLPVEQLRLKGLQLVPASQESNDSSQPSYSQMHSLPLHPQHAGSRPGTPSMRKRVLENNLQSPDNLHKRARVEPHNGHLDSSILARNSMPSASTQTQFTSQEGDTSVNSSTQNANSSTETIENLKTHLKGLDNGLNLALDKYEKTKEQLRVALNEKDDLAKQVGKLEAQLLHERESATALRQKRIELDEALIQAKKDLAEIASLADAASEDPAHKLQGELAREKQRCAELTANLSRVANGQSTESEKQLLTVKNELEFLRGQYQNRDSELNNTNQELTEEKEVTRKLKAQLENVKASQEGSKLRQTNANEQIKWLKAENESLKKQMGQKKGDKDRGRGMATRSGSTAPRSPRVAGASPAGSRIVSRHGSPVRREGVAGRRGRQMQGL